ncbi:MAG: DUF72 domain-containing protein, partial [Actinomycetes bacterium]
TTTDANRQIRHAMEVRHDSFKAAEATKVFRKHDIAVVVADTAGRWPLIEEDTSDFRYVRLHGDAELYASGYDEKALDRWAKKIRGWAKAEDVFVYFDNDVKGYAPFDAMELRRRLE